MYIEDFLGTDPVWCVAIDPRETVKPIGNWYDPDFIAMYNGERNLYFTPNEVDPEIAKNKPSKQDIRNIRWVFVDLDPDKDKDREKERERLAKKIKRINKSILKPTTIIDSGNGYQLLWRINAGCEFELAEQIGELLAKTFGGDAVQNVDRLLRIPDTRNIPTKKKLEAGYEECEAKLISNHDVSYDASELLVMLTPPSNKKDIQEECDWDSIELGPPKGLMDKALADEDINSIWQGNPTNNQSDTSRSGYDMALLAMLKYKGYTKTETFALLREYDYGKAHDTDKTYLERMWASSRAKPKMGYQAVITAIQKHEGDPIAIIKDTSELTMGLSGLEMEMVLKELKTKTKLPVGAIRKALADGASNEAEADEDLSHHDMAAQMINDILPIVHPPFIKAIDGSVYRFNNCYWSPFEDGELEVVAPENFNDQPRCKRTSDYNSIASHCYHVAYHSDQDFFKESLRGIATPGGFWTINDGEVYCEELDPNQRKRYGLEVTPKEGSMEKFSQFLQTTFKGSEEQIGLLQEIFGGVFFNLFPEHQKAVMFYGEGNTGKSTMLNIIEALIPDEMITSTSPFNWDDEYYTADLAGKLLNAVGELPDDKSIPSHIFKRVLGGDRIQGRHPTRRPFTFRNTATHIFNTNYLVNTSDHSNAFYRRWIIVEFSNPVPVENVQLRLEDDIIKEELPNILWWAMEGAVRVIENNGFTQTDTHQNLIQLWRRDANSVASFLFDEDHIIWGPDKKVQPRELYEAYETWCRDNNRARYGSKSFYKEVCNLVGVTKSEKDASGSRHYRGIGLLL